MLAWLFACLLLALFLPTAQAQPVISTDEWQQFVPNKNFPKEVKSRKSNNNLDAIRFKNKYYFAFRTAPHHFPAKKTFLYILSSDNMTDWKLEKTIYLKSDLREPRFAEYKGELFFYFFQGGKRMFRFEPKKIWATKTAGDSQWSDLRDTELDGFVPWRVRPRGDTLYMSAYYGINLYKNKHSADQRLLVSTDGFSFQPISDSAQCTTKGAEEGEFCFDTQGNMWATVRLEGSGSYVAYADKDNLATWKTTFSKYKYDSALMFQHKGEFYVIARKHLKKRKTPCESTPCDSYEHAEATPVEHPTKRQRRRNLVGFSLTKKRTALYRLDTTTHKLVEITDFPSTGDTAFPALMQRDENSYYLFNYSSNIRKRDRIWLDGQLRRTYIYWTVLKFQ